MVKAAAADIGRGGEDAALRFLKKRGLKLLVRNFRVRGGEIDLIMEDEDGVVFVEVRRRRAAAAVSAAESITAAKRARLTTAANHYFAARGGEGCCRFDAVLIDGDRLHWLKDIIH